MEEVSQSHSEGRRMEGSGSSASDGELPQSLACTGCNSTKTKFDSFLYGPEYTFTRLYRRFCYECGHYWTLPMDRAFSQILDQDYLPSVPPLRQCAAVQGRRKWKCPCSPLEGSVYCEHHSILRARRRSTSGPNVERLEQIRQREPWWPPPGGNKMKIVWVIPSIS